MSETPRCVSCHASVGPPPGWHTCALTAEHLVERLEVELATAVAEGERHKRNAECYACEAGDPDMDGVQDTKLSRAEAALLEWREAESLPDCAACSVLDAALLG